MEKNYNIILSILCIAACIALITPLYLTYIAYLNGYVDIMQAKQELNTQKITNAYKKNEVQIEKYRIEQLRTVLHTNENVIEYIQHSK